MATTYPWNGNRATREVIIENHEPGVKRRDLEMLGKSLSCQVRAVQKAQCEMFKKQAHMAKCNERKLMKKLNQVELLEVIRRRGGHGGGRRDELLELILLAGGEGGLGGGDGDNAALLAVLLEEERGGGRHHGGGGRSEEIELMMMNNRINKLSNNVTQLDTLLGVRPINPAAGTA